MLHNCPLVKLPKHWDHVVSHLQYVMSDQVSLPLTLAIFWHIKLLRTLQAVNIFRLSNDQIIENPTENHWPPKVQLNENQGQEIIIVSRQKNSTIVVQHLLFLSGDQLITYWNSWFKFHASCFSSLIYNLIILKKVIFV